MKNTKALLGMGLLVAGITGSAQAAIGDCDNEILVTQDIAVDTVWTADNCYNLQNQIYVLPGASLTIEAGTVVASTPTLNGSGSLAVTRGAKIFIQGTKTDPVIMTSTNDDGVTWREAANEWGNLTIMGNAYISNSFVTGNTATCGPNVSPMEGLVPEFDLDPNTIYGGTDDDDCSGEICYLSIRYGGRVIGLANELNGLSLGGLGRNTTIKYVEIMNNVDDGIEIWGGCVYLKYCNIWNIGDDSFDIDQGWRGCAQFILIVQGYSLDAGQGSGVGDNCFETDGAEDSDAQPRTRAAIYNATVIGQPLAGDGGTTWRDNAGVQYYQCIFMDLGEQLVRFDNLDGDGSQGYGFNGTRSWPEHWTTEADQFPLVNECDNPELIYKSQVVPGKICAICDSVFFQNLAGNAYTEADARGVRDASNDNVTADVTPIKSVVRAAPVTRGGLQMVRVIELNPAAINDAVNAERMPPADNDFFCPATYRGAFSPLANENWLCGWTATECYGFLAEKRCEGDANSDGVVNVTDLLKILGAWGPCPAPCNADTNCDCVVNVTDLLTVLGQWGDCP